MPAPDLAAALRERGWSCYALTTADRPERQRRLRAEFARAGLPVTVHVAERPSDAHGFASTGTHGCFLSHLAVLERAHADRARVAVVAEDDVVLSRALRRVVTTVADELAEQGDTWSTAYLGHLAASPARRQGLRLIGSHLARLDGWEVHGAHLYAVRGAALPALIEDFRRRLLPGGHRIAADGVLNEHRRDTGAPTLLALPNLAHQAPSPSGITRASGRLGQAKDRVLGHEPARAGVEAVKRLAWDLGGALPPRAHAWHWQRRSGTATAAVHG